METPLSRKMNELGMLNREMAEKINVALPTLRNWKYGMQDVGTYSLCNICAILDVSLEYMFGGEDTGWEGGISEENIANNLKYYRHKKGMSQIKVAEEIGAANATIYYWEKGKSLPSMYFIKPLCETLGITINQLFAKER